MVDCLPQDDSKYLQLGGQHQLAMTYIPSKVCASEDQSESALMAILSHVSQLYKAIRHCYKPNPLNK